MAVMVSSYHPIPVICRAVSGREIGQIDPLVNDHLSRLRPTVQGTAEAERPGQVACPGREQLGAYLRPKAYTLLLLVGAVKHSVPQYPEPQ